MPGRTFLRPAQHLSPSQAESRVFSLETNESIIIMPSCGTGRGVATCCRDRSHQIITGQHAEFFFLSCLFFPSQKLFVFPLLIFFFFSYQRFLSSSFHWRYRTPYFRFHITAYSIVDTCDIKATDSRTCAACQAPCSKLHAVNRPVGEKRRRQAWLSRRC
ncbi:hypothetical protein GGI43DRAFT_194676 [Trichoderma evansii]